MVFDAEWVNEMSVGRAQKAEKAKQTSNEFVSVSERNILNQYHVLFVFD